jgi:predicted permease
MSTNPDKSIKNWERIQSRGIGRFILIIGLPYGIVNEIIDCLMWHGSQKAWYHWVVESGLSGLMFALVMWFGYSWIFKRDKKKMDSN